jgi:hypothetical protein
MVVTLGSILKNTGLGFKKKGAVKIWVEDEVTGEWRKLHYESFTICVINII